MFYHSIYKNRAKLKHFVSVWQVIPIMIVGTLVIVFQYLFLFFVWGLRHVRFCEFFAESPVFFTSWAQKVVPSFKVANNLRNEFFFLFCQYASSHHFPTPCPFDIFQTTRRCTLKRKSVC